MHQDESFFLNLVNGNFFDQNSYTTYFFKKITSYKNLHQYFITGAGSKFKMSNYFFRFGKNNDADNLQLSNLLERLQYKNTNLQ